MNERILGLKHGMLRKGSLIELKIMPSIMSWYIVLQTPVTLIKHRQLCSSRSNHAS
jgi:hypothetical protein